MSNIIDSDIALSADIDSDATVINSKVGERCNQTINFTTSMEINAL